MQAEASLGGEKRVFCPVGVRLRILRLSRSLSDTADFFLCGVEQNSYVRSERVKEGKRKLPSLEPLFAFDHSFAFHMSVIPHQQFSTLKNHWCWIRWVSPRLALCWSRWRSAGGRRLSARLRGGVQNARWGTPRPWRRVDNTRRLSCLSHQSSRRVGKKPTPI